MSDGKYKLVWGVQQDDGSVLPIVEIRSNEKDVKTMSDVPYKANAVGGWIEYAGKTVPHSNLFSTKAICEVVPMLNSAYADGFTAGRASRDALVEAAKSILFYLDARDDEDYAVACFKLKKALEDK